LAHQKKGKLQKVCRTCAHCAEVFDGLPQCTKTGMVVDYRNKCHSWKGRGDG